MDLTDDGASFEVTRVHHRHGADSVYVELEWVEPEYREETP
jgi:hypothetical protein